MDVLTSETCWTLNNEIMKPVTSCWSLFIQVSVSQSTTSIACISVSFKLTTCFDPHFWAIIRSHTYVNWGSYTMKVITNLWLILYSFLNLRLWPDDDPEMRVETCSKLKWNRIQKYKLRFGLLKIILYPTSIHIHYICVCVCVCVYICLLCFVASFKSSFV